MTTPGQREAARERSRRWRAANPEKSRAAALRYRAGHLEGCRERSRRYQAEHAEARHEAVKRFRAARPETSKEITRRWYARNRDAVAVTFARWHQENPEKVHEIKRRRRARKAGITTIIKTDMNGPCAICHRPIDRSLKHPEPMSFSIGHEPPLAWAEANGVTESVERPEHLTCNLRKGVRPDSMLTERVA